MKCPFYESCPYGGKVSRLKTLMGDFTQIYCDTEFSACERYQRKEEGGRVPIMLLPDGRTIRRNSSTKSGIEIISD